MVTIERVFETTLDVQDPVGFCADREGEALMRTRENMEGKCFKGFYVDEVLCLERLSEVRLLGPGGHGAGYVDVAFRARATRFFPGYPVVGVHNVRPVPLCVGEAKNPPIMVAFRNEGGSALVGADQTVPAQIVEVKYAPAQARPCAMADLLHCQQTRRRWLVQGSTTVQDTEQLRSAVEAVRVELDRRATLRTQDTLATDDRQGTLGGKPQSGRGADAVDFFEKLLATFPAAPGDKPVTGAGGWEGPPVPPLPARLAAGTAHALLRLAAEPRDLTGYWEHPMEYPRSCPVLVHKPLDAPADPADPPAAPTAPRAFLTDALFTTAAWLRAATDLPLCYPTEADLNRHKHIWEFMRRKQLPRE